MLHTGRLADSTADGACGGGPNGFSSIAASGGGGAGNGGGRGSWVTDVAVLDSMASIVRSGAGAALRRERTERYTSLIASSTRCAYAARGTFRCLLFLAHTAFAVAFIAAVLRLCSCAAAARCRASCSLRCASAATVFSMRVT